MKLERELGVQGFMTEKYQHGNFINAPNINCNIGFDTTNITRNMKMTVYDFASYATSTDYCLYIEDVQEPLICSGLKNFLKSFGPYESINGFKFWMALNNSVTIIPRIRLWITIASKIFSLYIWYLIIY